MINGKAAAVCVAAALGLCSCAKPESATAPNTPVSQVTKKSFGQTAEGQAVGLYTLRNANGVEASIMNLGAILVSLKAPDKAGNIADIVLGFDNLDGYLKPNPYFGAVVGRYGNRIAKGRFTLDGKTYKLAVNNGANHLHGGIKGFDKAMWTARAIESPDKPGVELKYLSKDGEEGYPGNLNVTVTYSLSPNNELRIDYLAVTDKDTVLNLTNHSYFNLSGGGAPDILRHDLMLNADSYTPVDAGLIPTGEVRSVEGSPFDFRKPTAIGARIGAPDEQLKRGNGYDHNFVVNRAGPGLELIARASDPSSGRVLEVLTTQPAVQFYTGNFLDGTLAGKGGKPVAFRSGFCLETQHYPDSPNHPAFPSVVLKPGETYQASTVFRLSAQGAGVR